MARLIASMPRDSTSEITRIKY